jgi:hypothetical protein
LSQIVAATHNAYGKDQLGAQAAFPLPTLHDAGDSIPEAARQGSILLIVHPALHRPRPGLPQVAASVR